MIKVLVSACLLGERVRYDGAHALCASDVLAAWLREGRIVPFCPEVAGGFPVPRPPAEIAGGGGADVLRGAASVRDRHGRDVTAYFLDGARQALDAARREGARLAILKDGSPSCGSSFIYDGRFTGARKAEAGVTAALLESEGIRVFSEEHVGAAAEYLSRLEAAAAAP